MAAAIRAVTLDVGGVLELPDHDLVREAVKPFADALSANDIDAAHYRALYTTDSAGLAALLPANYEGWRKQYVKELGVSDAHTTTAADRIRRAFDDGRAYTHVVPGAHKMLRRLSDRKLRIAIISNTIIAGVVQQSLRELRLCQVGDGDGVCVDAILDSNEVGVSKPDPRIFEAALGAMNAAPEEAIHVGDSVIADVAGARNVGMGAIHFDPFDVCGDDEHPHLHSFHDLERFLQLG